MTDCDNIGLFSNEYSFNNIHYPLSFRFNPQLDVNYLNDYYQENISDAAFMFDIFLSCTVQKFYEFIEFTLSNQKDEVFRLAHQMIPTFKLVGLTKIARQLKELENKVKQSYSLSSLVKSIDTDFKKAMPIIFTQRVAINSFLRQQEH